MIVDCWNTSHLDPEVAKHVTHWRVPVNVGDFKARRVPLWTDPFSGTGRGWSGWVERYIAEQQGDTYRDLIEAAKEEGKKIIFVLTGHWRNGRELWPGEKPTATGPGEYQMNAPLIDPFGYEGSVVTTINKILDKAAAPDSPIVALEIFNEEPYGVNAVASYCEIAAKARDKRGVGVAIGCGFGLTPQGWKQMGAGAQYCDFVDPHLINRNWRNDLGRACAIAERNGCEVWPLEMSHKATDGNYFGYLKGVYAQTGCASFFVAGIEPWNNYGEPVRNYALNHDATARATALTFLRGLGDGPVDPPEPPAPDPDLSERYWRALEKYGEEGPVLGGIVQTGKPSDRHLRLLRQIGKRLDRLEGR